MMYSLKSSELSEETNILSTSKSVDDIETSLKDSLRMLYDDAPPNSIKRSMLYVFGGKDIPIGTLDSITNIAGGMFQHSTTHVEQTSDESKVVVLSAVSGQTKFDSYDPLGMIPEEKTVDWNEPECSIDCVIDLPQLE